MLLALLLKLVGGLTLGKALVDGATKSQNDDDDDDETPPCAKATDGKDAMAPMKATAVAARLAAAAARVIAAAAAVAVRVTGADANVVVGLIGVGAGWGAAAAASAAIAPREAGAADPRAGGLRSIFFRGAGRCCC